MHCTHATHTQFTVHSQHSSAALTWRSSNLQKAVFAVQRSYSMARTKETCPQTNQNSGKPSNHQKLSNNSKRQSWSGSGRDSYQLSVSAQDKLVNSRLAFLQPNRIAKSTNLDSTKTSNPHSLVIHYTLFSSQLLLHSTAFFSFIVHSSDDIHLSTVSTVDSVDSSQKRITNPVFYFQVELFLYNFLFAFF